MTNMYLVAPLATVVIAQVLKFAIQAFHGRLEFRTLVATGGMPSVHSATVVSLATTAALLDGFNSHLFGLAAVVAVIVIYDSFGVRKAVGDQSVALNALIAESAKTNVKPVPEVLGHTSREVLAGSALGFVLAGIFSFQKLGWLGDFITAVPAKHEYNSYAIAGLVLFLLGIAVRLFLPSVRKNSLAILNLAKSLASIFSITGLLAMLSALLTYEQASYLAWRLWAVLTLAVGAGLLIRRAIKWFTMLPEELAAEAEKHRKAKWFNFGKSGKTKKRTKKA